MLSSIWKNHYNTIKALIYQLEIVIVFAVLYYLANKYNRRFGAGDILYHDIKLEDKKDSKNNKKVPELTFFDCFYFSLVTQTTVGYGDIVTHTPLTRIINIIQLISVYLSWKHILMR